MEGLGGRSEKRGASGREGKGCEGQGGARAVIWAAFVMQGKTAGKKLFYFSSCSAFEWKDHCISDAIFTLISDQASEQPRRCISLFEQGGVVCFSVKLQTTSGHIW